MQFRTEIINSTVTSTSVLKHLCEEMNYLSTPAGHVTCFGRNPNALHRRQVRKKCWFTIQYLVPNKYVHDMTLRINRYLPKTNMLVFIMDTGCFLWDGNRITQYSLHWFLIFLSKVRQASDSVASGNHHKINCRFVAVKHRITVQ